MMLLFFPILSELCHDYICHTLGMSGLLICTRSRCKSLTDVFEGTRLSNFKVVFVSNPPKESYLIL